MYGWCKKCNALAVEGLCSKHGKTEPITSINAIEVFPLPEFEKKILNQHLDGLELGEGIFLVYNDRIFRRRVVILDKPLVEIKLKKDGLHVNSFIKGKVKGMEIDSLCDVNKERIKRLTEITKSFAKYEIKSNGKSIISFSGGKDSMVLAHLLKEFNLKKVFIDTTIEFPETYEFIKKLQKENWNIDIVKSKTNFFTLCGLYGYPAYKNRWCSKTQKFIPFASYLKKNFGNKKILVFSGMRRWESLARLEQPLEKPHKHITNQNTGQPILDWLSMDMWIYTWIHKLPINKIYNYFDRCGCWACPFGLKYRLFLLQFTHPKLHRILQETLDNISIEINNAKSKKLIINA